PTWTSRVGTPPTKIEAMSVPPLIEHNQTSPTFLYTQRYASGESGDPVTKIERKADRLNSDLGITPAFAELCKKPAPTLKFVARSASAISQTRCSEGYVGFPSSKIAVAPNPSADIRPFQTTQLVEATLRYRSPARTSE